MARQPHVSCCIPQRNQSFTILEISRKFNPDTIWKSSFKKIKHPNGFKLEASSWLTRCCQYLFFHNSQYWIYSKIIIKFKYAYIFLFLSYIQISLEFKIWQISTKSLHSVYPTLNHKRLVPLPADQKEQVHKQPEATGSGWQVSYLQAVASLHRVNSDGPENGDYFAQRFADSA